MTSHSHELGSPAGHHPSAPAEAPGVGQRPAWSRWLVPAAVAGVVVVVLLVSGVLSPTFLLYGGLLAGYSLMHLFGHGGHGGHSGHGSGGEPGGGAAPSVPREGSVFSVSPHSALRPGAQPDAMTNPSRPRRTAERDLP